VPELLSGAAAWPSAVEVILVALAALAGSLLSGLTGSGAGIVLSIALLPIVGVRAVVPILSIAMVLSHVGRVYAFRRAVNWRAGMLLVLLALPGSVIGSLVYARLPERATAAVLGIFLLGLIAVRAARPDRQVKLSTPVWVVAAILYGFLNGLTLGAGILVLPLLMFFGFGGVALVATDALVGLGMNLVKAVSFGAFELITPAVLVSGLIVGGLTLPGAFVARAIIARLSLRAHERLIDATIAIAALSMLWQSVVA
jgi:uncharacterized membrane protein YfcA